MQSMNGSRRLVNRIGTCVEFGELGIGDMCSNSSIGALEGGLRV